MNKDLMKEFEEMYLRQTLIMRGSLLNRPVVISSNKKDKGYVLVGEELQVLTGRATIRSNIFSWDTTEKEALEKYKNSVNEIRGKLDGRL